MAGLAGPFSCDPSVSLISGGRANEIRWNWRGAGCPGSVCVALGDQVVRVPFPPAFPREAVGFEAAPSVYGRERPLALASAAGQPHQDIRLTLTLSALDVPFALLRQEGPLVDGYGASSRWEEGVRVGPVHGVTLRHYRRVIPEGREKEMVTGAACRPEGLRHSVLVARLDHPATVASRELVEEGDRLWLLKHYVQPVTYIWHTFECEEGSWTRKDVLSDPMTRRFTLRVEAF